MRIKIEAGFLANRSSASSGLTAFSCTCSDLWIALLLAGRLAHREAAARKFSPLDDGWKVGAGGGLNFGPYFGAMIDLDYNSFGINSTTLSNIGVPGGGCMFSQRHWTR